MFFLNRKKKNNIDHNNYIVVKEGWPNAYVLYLSFPAQWEWGLIKDVSSEILLDTSIPKHLPENEDFVLLTGFEFEEYKKYPYIQHYNRWPRNEKMEISASEFFKILEGYAGLTENAPQYRQVMFDREAANIFIYRMGTLAIAMGEHLVQGKYVLKYWRFGTEKEWQTLNKKQTLMFAGDNT